MPRIYDKFLHFLSLIYGLIMAARNVAYDHGLIASYSVNLPIWVAGNATVGGNGKTPFCIGLANFLKERGKSPVILTRGYGRKTTGLLLVNNQSSPEEVGDEPVLIYAETGLPVVVCADRYAGARYIEQNKLGDLILLDDALQHRRLHRDRNFLLIDVSRKDWLNTYQECKLLPWGFFRENFKRLLKRIDSICLINRSLQPVDWADTKAELAHLLGGHQPLIICGQLESCGIRNILKAEQELEPQAVCLVAAIAEPGGFISSVEKLGFVIQDQILFKDHHSFTQKDIQEINERAAGLPVVSTAKDAVKLRKFDAVNNFYQLNVKLVAEYEKLLSSGSF